MDENIRKQILKTNNAYEVIIRIRNFEAENTINFQCTTATV